MNNMLFARNLYSAFVLMSVIHKQLELGRSQQEIRLLAITLATMEIGDLEIYSFSLRLL
jgi:hypothetical protein